jgi:hypothetical protein
MRRNIIDEGQRKYFESLEVVQQVTRSQIEFTPEFKATAAQAYTEGVYWKDIFTRAGVDVDQLAPRYGSTCLRRWAKALQTHGKNAFKMEHRGRSRRDIKEMNLELLQAELAYLREENALLKKFRALGHL